MVTFVGGTYIDRMDEANISNDEQPEREDETSPKHGSSTLHRSATKRIFGGVAGGLGERFDLDANIVRVIFVVLALVYGLGIALYLAMWVLIPLGESSGVATSVPAEEMPRVKWLRYALPLAVVVLAVIFISTVRFVPNLGKAFSLLWLVFLIVLAVVALFSPARRLTFRRFVALALLGFMSLLIVFSGAVLLALQVIGVPVRGGSGAREWAPTSLSEVQRSYHGAFGATTVDLSRVAFTGTTSITATEGIGGLTVDVPTDVTIDLRTNVGIGTVQHNFEVQLPGTSTIVPGNPASVHGKGTLVLNLQVGIGEILINYVPAQ